MRISILCDSESNWFVKYAKELHEMLCKKGHDSSIVYKSELVPPGEICFILSYTKLIPKEYLERNKNNIVVHASDLPEGKGFSPLQWQIYNGAAEVTLTLFEVVEDVDSGPYYLEGKIKLEGHELLTELRARMADEIIKMCTTYVENYDSLKPMEQEGTESYFPRRKKVDDQLDVNKSIAEQFNHFRIADNDNFPVFFEYRGYRYNLKIYKE